MATSKEYKDFILEQLDLLDNITCKAMMGEFLLYYNNVLFGNPLQVSIIISFNSSLLSTSSTKYIGFALS